MTDETTDAKAADTGTSAQTITEDTDTAKTDSSKPTPPEDNNETNSEAKTFTQAEVSAIVSREAKKATKAAIDAETQKRADAEKTEAQLAGERADEAERKALAAEERVSEFLVRNAVQSAASDPKLNARDANAVALLVNRQSLEVDGEAVNGVDAELKRIQKSHPALFYNTSADGGATGQSNGAVDFNAEIRRLASRN